MPAHDAAPLAGDTRVRRACSFFSPSCSARATFQEGHITSAGGVNIPLMLRDHLPLEARALKAEIAAMEAALDEKRAQLLQHQQVALVVGIDLDAPVASTETKTGAPVVAEDARASSETGSTSGPIPLAA